MIEYVEWGIIYVDSDDISSSTKTVCTLRETHRNLNKHTKTITLLIKKNLPFGFFSVDIYFD